jgi:hypothetical protein
MIGIAGWLVAALIFLTFVGYVVWDIVSSSKDETNRRAKK